MFQYCSAVRRVLPANLNKSNNYFPSTPPPQFSVFFSSLKSVFKALIQYKVCKFSCGPQQSPGPNILVFDWTQWPDWWFPGCKRDAFSNEVQNTWSDNSIFTYILHSWLVKALIYHSLWQQSIVPPLQWSWVTYGRLWRIEVARVASVTFGVDASPYAGAVRVTGVLRDVESLIGFLLRARSYVGRVTEHEDGGKRGGSKIE
jgi:hypothetical protein